MPSYAVITHGGRDAGTSTGTYVVPPNVTIYFYTLDEQLMDGSGASIIEDNLLTAHPNEIGVQKIATEVKKQYDTIPNYVMSGDVPGGAFRFATGVYQVGKVPGAGPFIPVPKGTEKRLSDLIGGQTGKGAIGINIYWLACRAAPVKFSELSETGGGVTAIGGKLLATERLAGAVKPSMVLAAGGKWL